MTMDSFRRDRNNREGVDIVSLLSACLLQQGHCKDTSMERAIFFLCQVSHYYFILFIIIIIIIVIIITFLLFLFILLLTLQ